MTGALPRVFTIAASADFAASLAAGLKARMPEGAPAFSDAIIYLPTRRAARSFGERFAALAGGAALLPDFRALGETEEDDLLFDAASEALELPPAIAPIRRQLLLAHLVRPFADLPFAQAFALGESLAGVMDDAERQDVSLGDIERLAPPDLAEHWQKVARFLALLDTQWPDILKAEGAQNPVARRNIALRALARRLEAAPPPGMVIAAGSTGSIPATADLLAVIARLPNGAVVLPGLDRDLDDAAWNTLDPAHPQFGLKQLLARIGVERSDVADWDGDAPNPARETLLRQALRPAPTTDAWRALADAHDPVIAAGCDGLAHVAAATPAEEAFVIALALREALETPGKTAALVTPDRNLARRVAAEMKRWNVAVDDSAGRPLAHTRAGSFLCLVADAAGAQFAPVPLLALLKHPLATGGGDAGAFRAHARDLDRFCLRGPRPDAGLDGIARAIARARADKRNRDHDARLAALAEWWNGVAVILKPLEKLAAPRDTSLAAWVQAHTDAAQALARDEGQDAQLWRNADGETAWSLMTALIEAADGLPPIAGGIYPALFRTLAMQRPVRAAFGQHPRLAILGTLEARLQRFDRIILGGLNEGGWPMAASADPWFSRPMRHELKLEQPERAIGLAAHDFAMLAAGPDVILTRAAKQDGAPTVASRWLQRMEQLLLGLQPEAKKSASLAALLKPEPDYAALAAAAAAVPQGARIERPAPMPPVEARPRRLSITEIETWLRDPYAIYAKHVLKLEPLKGLDEPLGARERGTALHAALERFLLEYPDGVPDDAVVKLAEIADAAFAEAGAPKAALAVWRPRFLAAAQAFMEIERARRAVIARSFVERKGKLTFKAPGGDFHLTGRADRIDLLQGGGAAIVDYKSGAVPTKKQVTGLLSPQLPLEAAMLAKDAFPEMGAHLAETLIYLSLADGRKAAAPVEIGDAAALADKAWEKLNGRIIAFDDVKAAYISRLIPYRSDSEGDYDHLARVREWSAAGDGE